MVQYLHFRILKLPLIHIEKHMCFLDCLEISIINLGNPSYPRYKETYGYGIVRCGVPRSDLYLWFSTSCFFFSCECCFSCTQVVNFVNLTKFFRDLTGNLSRITTCRSKKHYIPIQLSNLIRVCRFYRTPFYHIMFIACTHYTYIYIYIQIHLHSKISIFVYTVYICI